MFLDLLKYAKFIESKRQIQEFDKYYFYDVEWVKLNWVRRLYMDYSAKYNPHHHNDSSAEDLANYVSSSFLRWPKNNIDYARLAVVGIPVIASTCKIDLIMI